MAMAQEIKATDRPGRQGASRPSEDKTYLP